MEAQREISSEAPPVGRLEARDLHFGFAKRAILKGVNLVLMPGEVVSLIGQRRGQNDLVAAVVGIGFSRAGRSLDRRRAGRFVVPPRDRNARRLRAASSHDAVSLYGSRGRWCRP